jgi:hypothetical protein
MPPTAPTPTHSRSGSDCGHREAIAAEQRLGAAHSAAEDVLRRAQRETFYDVPKLNVSMRPYPGVVMGLIDLPNQELALTLQVPPGTPASAGASTTSFVGER